MTALPVTRFLVVLFTGIHLMAIVPAKAQEKGNKTIYNRKDGGVTVVEPGTNIFGDRVIDYRTYPDQESALIGEYGTEIKIGAAAIALLWEGGKAIYNWWQDNNQRENTMDSRYDPVLPKDIKRWQDNNQREITMDSRYDPVLPKDNKRWQDKKNSENSNSEVSQSPFPQITSVDPEGIGARIGLKPGDYILRYNGNQLDLPGVPAWIIGDYVLRYNGNPLNVPSKDPVKWVISATDINSTPESEITIWRDYVTLSFKVPSGRPLGVRYEMK